MATSRTFPVDVDGIGRFTFRQRRVIEQIKIEAEVEKAIGGEIQNKQLENALFAYLTLQTLLVSAPDEFVLENIDPLDRDDTARMWKVWEALRDEEARFRSGAGKHGEAPRPGAG